MFCKFWVVTMAAVCFLASRAWALGVGDHVEAWNLDWYGGTITEIGSGSYAGYYKVKWDKFAGSQYIKAANIRSQAAAKPAAASSAPASGRYVCMGYSGPIASFRWYLDLADGHYRQIKPDLPAGSYRFDGHILEFTSGPYRANDWIGEFSVERGGKTQRIVLRSRTAQGRAHEYANIYCSLSSGR